MLANACSIAGCDRPAVAGRAIAVLLLSALHGCAPPSDSRPTARHLLLITVDTLRADRVGCYGGRPDVSPAIDRLAAEGARFAQAYAPTGMTIPSLTSIHTAAYPDETGVVGNVFTLPAAAATLAERLRANGFRTRALVANGLLAEERSGLEQGFDVYEFMADEVRLTDQAVALVSRGFREDTREFLWLHYMNPHGPYDAPPPYARMFDPDYAGGFDGSPACLHAWFRGERPAAERDLEHVRALYDGQVRFVDDLIACVLAALHDRGAEDATLVVLTADHGEELGERNRYFDHANSIYGAVTRVPLVFRLPDAIERGTKISGLVELVDVAPSALALLGLGTAIGEERPSGQDLGPILRGARTKSEVLHQHTDRIRALRTERYLYVSNPTGFWPKAGAKGGTYPIGKRELFDLETDPGEAHDVANDLPQVAEQLERRLESRFAALRRPTTETKPVITEEGLRLLESLGYVGGR